ncbi:hypothetical protein [Streptomyces pseudovenezuelae]|uniref:hypothetical protein n=1 Tax=Streptomyces pseudovenezuelae TaxID=67350 RepID=UPI002E8156FF|nr:hypothetical protein [Streptomyces pseudovenezuelae]WUA94442.1 hypothetical protein OHO81_45195 [Streptomyces pseudovenezuelae]
MTTTKNASPVTAEPPAAAVAADAHWTATRDRLRNRQRPTASLVICDDPDLKKAVEEAKWTVRRITTALEAEPDDADLQRDLTTAQKALETVQADFDQVAIVLRFQALRRPDWEDLKKNHPPTEEQAEDNFVVNVETLGPHLIAASSLDGVTAEDAQYYLDEWSEGEASALFQTAWNIQSGTTRMDVGKG